LPPWRLQGAAVSVLIRGAEVIDHICVGPRGPRAPLKQEPSASIDRRALVEAGVRVVDIHGGHLRGREAHVCGQ